MIGWRSNWRARSECKARGLDPDLFFPDVGEPIDPVVMSACSACQVRAQCLRTAMRAEAAAGPDGGRIRRYGIFGGLTPKQRSALAKGRKIRPLVTNATRNKSRRGYAAQAADRARVAS